MLDPTLNPVTPVVAELGLVTEDVPDKTVHTPVPTAGVFPFKVAVVAHTVCENPAFAVVG